MSADTAPAEMPGEEDVARVLARLRSMFAKPGRDWRTGDEFVHGVSSQDVVDILRQAASALALFAPILAEKEREIERLDGERAIYFDMSAKAEARALAAEAALAAERERCALIAANETIHPLGEQIAAAIRARQD